MKLLFCSKPTSNIYKPKKVSFVKEVDDITDGISFFAESYGLYLYVKGGDDFEERLARGASWYALNESGRVVAREGDDTVIDDINSSFWIKDIEDLNDTEIHALRDSTSQLRYRFL